ncbi:hypothetical protein FGRMN_1392 [Fusarium graminum]|nr:hypothetical protein FGRMN_1392 [Fusarium graminum]
MSDTSSSSALRSPFTLSSSSTSLLRTLAYNPQCLSSPFVALACNVFSRGPRRARTDVEQNLWSRIVPQLAHLVPSVRAAVEAFGSSYSEYALKVETPHPGLETTRRYSQALRLLQQDLSTLQYGHLPGIIACLLLACVEVLQQRLDKSHLHLLGAFSLLLSRANNTLLADIDVGSISFLFQKLDLHVATYSVSSSPHLPQSPTITTDIMTSLPPDRSLYKILHSCYHFTAQAFPFKYTNRRLTPPDLLIEQGRQLGALKQWLSYNSLHTSGDVGEDEPLLVLRAQCLIALIHTSNILEPRETSYDYYGPEFQEIIITMEALWKNNTCQHDNLPSFTPEMGVIYPLYYTAKKYRSSYWRRKALNLIQESGKEGPWCSETESSMIETLIKIEESSLDKRFLAESRDEHSAVHTLFDIPEQDRVRSTRPTMASKS